MIFAIAVNSDLGLDRHWRRSSWWQEGKDTQRSFFVPQALSRGSPLRSVLGRWSFYVLEMTFTVELNLLLRDLDLPFTLETPRDLVPSLLLAILEAIIQTRLPISDALRQSSSIISRIDCIKIFLGFFEHDVLRQDVGLSEVDPRKLALGRIEEVEFIGNLLLWLARDRGLFDPSRSSSPSTFTITEGTNLSMNCSASADTNATTAMPYLTDNSSNEHSLKTSIANIRFGGSIQVVDYNSELMSFEMSSTSRMLNGSSLCSDTAVLHAKVSYMLIGLLSEIYDAYRRPRAVHRFLILGNESITRLNGH